MLCRRRDEFALLLPNESDWRVAQKLLNALRKPFRSRHAAADGSEHGHRFLRTAATATPLRADVA
jgi:hypothetical protein